MIVREKVGVRLARMWPLVVLAVLVNCTTDRLLIHDAQNLNQGQIKTLTADLQTGQCGNSSVGVQFKKSTDPATAWQPSGNATLSGTTYTSLIPGSDAFLGGDTYDFRWLHDHDAWDFSSILPTCNGREQTIYPGSFTVIGPAFSLSASPNPLTVQTGRSSTLTIGVTRLGGFSGPVTVSANPPGFPNGTLAAPPFPLTITSASVATSVSASFTAPVGQSTVTLQGSATGASGPPLSLTVSVVLGPPSITSVTPSRQAPGGTITVAGNNFDNSNCGNNVVNIGLPGSSASATANGGCSQGSLTASVPSQVPVDATQLTVTTGGQTSNALPFTVARQPGSFVDITGGVVGQTSSGRTSSAGVMRVDVCPPNCPGYPVGEYVAQFKRTSNGSSVGSAIPFHSGSARLANVGGAGFDIDSVGIVLDGDATGYSPQLMGVYFVDLRSGTMFQPNPYTFNFVTPSGTASYNPAILRSPDGTIVLTLTAATIGPAQLTAAFFDRKTHNKFGQIDITQVSGAIVASVTSNNQVSFSFGGTTYPPINIP